MRKKRTTKKIRGLIFGLALFFAISLTCLQGGLASRFGNITPNKKVQTTDLVKTKRGYRLAKATGKITLKFKEPTYVQNIAFDFIPAKEETGVRFAVLADEKNLLPQAYQKDEVPKWYLSQHSFVVRRKVRQIELDFKKVGELPKDTFQIKHLRTDNHFTFNWFIFWSTFLISGLILAGVFKLWQNIGFERFVVGIVLCFGFLLAYFIPPHATFDEFSHLVRSYATSQGAVFYHEDQKLNYPKLEQTNFMSQLDYQSYQEYRLVKPQQQKFSLAEVKKRVINTPQIVYLFIPYLPSALGIGLAKVLHLSVFAGLLLARLGNLLFYTLCLNFCLRKFPTKRNFLALYALLPVNLYLAVNLSGDVVVNSLLLVACTLLLQGKAQTVPLTLKQYLGLIAALAGIALTKSTYAFCFLLLVLLPKKKLPQRLPAVVHWLSATLLPAVLFGAVYLYGNQFGLAQWNRPGVVPNEQVHFVLQHLVVYARQMWDALTTDFSGNVIHPFSVLGYLGNLKGIYAFIMFGLLSLFALTDERKNDDQPALLTGYDRIVLLLTIAAGYVLSYTALYVTFTPVGQSWVEGFQKRYFLPLLFMLFLAFHNQRFTWHVKSDTLKQGTILLTGLFYLVTANLLYLSFYR